MTLLNRIERHLRRTGGRASVLGRALMNDPGFVRELRRGREPRPETEARILAWLDAAEEKASERCAR